MITFLLLFIAIIGAIHCQDANEYSQLTEAVKDSELPKGKF